MEVNNRYRLVYTKKALCDIPNLKAVGLAKRVEILCIGLEDNPKPYESKQLLGNLRDLRSIRINIKHRLVYKIIEQEKIVKILSLWGHY